MSEVNSGTAAEPDEVLVEIVDGGVAVVTINRPRARNAVNGAVARGIAAALDELDESPDVSAIVLTGAAARSRQAWT
ncbi:hypothetical protein GCM10027612_19700 [Microbispora bryophytorum subsp. camponoti]